MLDADHVKRINLIEVLLEECEEQHGEGSFEPPPEDAYTWSEERIRSFFAEICACSEQDSQQTVCETQSLIIHATPATASHPVATTIIQARGPGVCPIQSPGTSASTSCGEDSVITASSGTASLCLPPRLAPPSKEMFDRWFPGLARSGTAQPSPRLRVICFPSAGNAEDMYTSEGTGARRAVSPLLSWCKKHQAELLAVQPPGRGARIKEQPCESAQHMALDLMQVLESRLCDGLPYVILSHSMGCWVAFEMMMLACRTAMPAPDLEIHLRPWRQQRSLAQDEFKVECRGWDINETVFTPGLWEVYEPLLRADFRIFDEYTHLPPQTRQFLPIAHSNGNTSDLDPAPTAVFTFPIVAFWGKHDRRVTEQMVRAWGRFTSGAFACSEVDGNHLWPLAGVPKMYWLEQVVKELDRVQL